MDSLVEDLPSVDRDDETTTDTRCASTPSPPLVYKFTDRRNNERDTCTKSNAFASSFCCLETSMDSKRFFFDKIDSLRTGLVASASASASNIEIPLLDDMISRSGSEHSSFTGSSKVASG